MSRKHLLAASVVLLGAISAGGQATPEGHSQSAPAANKKQGNATHTTQPQEEGERIFQQNCSRCHTAPESFSPHISGTIVRHMRVRASLSQHDEEELLRFLNP